MSYWNDDRVETLKSLWQEGFSASQVAHALGGVTRNAVIGKVHRLGLSGRDGAPRVSRPRVPAAPRYRAPTRCKAVVTVIEQDPFRFEDGNPRDHAHNRQGHVPLAHRRSDGGGVSFLRLRRQVRLALLRSARPESPSAAEEAARYGAAANPPLRVTN